MEAKNRTPNHLNKAGEDNKLKTELEISLDREIDKSPDDIDVQKVDTIINLLNQIDGISEERDEISKSKFAKIYLSECNLPEREEEIPKTQAKLKKWKVAVSLLGMALILGMGNIISVRATSNDIFTFIKNKAYVMYFDVFEKSNREKPSIDNSLVVQEPLLFENKQVDSWEESQIITGLSFKTPQFIPEGLSARTIHIQMTENDDIGISRQYYNDNDESSVRFLIRCIKGNGKWMSAMDQVDNKIEQKEINEYSVSFYQADDMIQAIYQDEQFIYVVDTNMEQEILEKIIKEMR